MGLELAGILIYEGIVPLDGFPIMFETKYRQLTQFLEPGIWLWSKDETIFTMFDDLYKSLLARNESAALLLTLCSIYGTWEIPIAFLRRLELYGLDRPFGTHDHWRQLQALVKDDFGFNRAIYELYRVFLANRKQGSDRSLITISLHGSICQWRFATIGDNRAEWIMQASYGLARHVSSCYDQ